MLIEHRAYTLKPGCLDQFYAAQRTRGFELVRPIGERLISYFCTQSGPEQQIVHLYRFDGYDDWSRRLHGLYGVKALEPYFMSVRPLMLAQENKFLVPAPVAALTPLLGNGNDWLPGGPLFADIAAIPDMIIEESTLVMTPGSLPRYWAAYEAQGLKSGLATQHLIGVFMSVVGRLHQVIHYRCFPTFAACRVHRESLQADARWRGFLEAVAPMTVSAETRLLAPAPVREMTPLFARPAG